MTILSRLSLLVLIGSGVILPEIIGAMQEGYSSSANYLSELGAVGAPHATLIRYGSFLPIGLAVIVLVFGLFQKFSGLPTAKLGALLLLGIAIGYLGAFFFSCDAGCPTEGSARQSLHNLGGLIEYVGAMTGLFAIYFGVRKQASFAFSAATILTLLMVALGFFMMLSPDMQGWKGAWQRLAEYSLAGWFVFATLWQPASAKMQSSTSDA